MKPFRCGHCGVGPDYLYWEYEDWYCLICGWYNPETPKSIIDTIEEALAPLPGRRGRPRQ